MDGAVPFYVGVCMVVTKRETAVETKVGTPRGDIFEVGVRKAGCRVTGTSVAVGG